MNQATGPALMDYTEAAGDTSMNDAAWSCPMTFPPMVPESESDALTAQLQQESQLLRPWYDEGLRARGRTEVGTSGKGSDSIDEMLGILARFAVDADMAVPDGYDHSMPQLLRYIAEDIRDFYVEVAISKPGAAFPSPLDLPEWFFLQTIASDVFYQVRDRLLAADILVPVAQGLDNDMIASRLSSQTGTTASQFPVGNLIAECRRRDRQLWESAQARE